LFQLGEVPSFLSFCESIVKFIYHVGMIIGHLPHRKSFKIKQLHLLYIPSGNLWSVKMRRNHGLFWEPKAMNVLNYLYYFVVVSLQAFTTIYLQISLIYIILKIVLLFILFLSCFYRFLSVRLQAYDGYGVRPKF